MRLFTSAPRTLVTGLVLLAALVFGATAFGGGDKVRFQGKLIAPPDAKVPDNASAEVMLVEVSSDYTDPSSIVSRDLGTVSDRAIPYDISVDSDKLQDGQQYALRAKVTTDGGETHWTNGNIWPVEPPTGDTVTAFLSLTQPEDGSA